MDNLVVSLSRNFVYGCVILMLILNLPSAAPAETEDSDETQGPIGSELLKEPLVAAVRSGDPTLVKSLLAKGADLNEKIGDCKGLPLIIAVIRNDIPMVKFLLSKGAGVNENSCSSGTPLMAACGGKMQPAFTLAKIMYKGGVWYWEGARPSSCSYVEMAKLLLAHGAEVNATATESWGMTALIAAARDGCADLVRLLLDNGADVNAQTSDNRTAALFFAAEGGFNEAVQLLLDKGANINAQTSNGRTALMAAIEQDFPDTVRLLLESAPDLGVKDKSGFTALRHAEIRNNRHALELFRRTEAPNAAAHTKMALQRPPQQVENGDGSGSLNTYPETPEGVIIAFEKEARETPIRSEEMRSCKEALLPQEKYFVREDEMGLLTSERSEDPLLDHHHLYFFSVITDFEIKKVIRGDDYAEVTVSYSRFGKVWEAGTYDYDKKCNQGRFTETGLNNRGSSKKIDNDTGMPLSDYCSYLQITNDTFYVTYSLEKPGKFWRILDGYKERCLSLSSAVKVMECWATQERKEDPLPSKNQTVQINKVINMLKVINTFKEEAARWDN